jgi:hypothetical protein
MIHCNRIFLLIGMFDLLSLGSWAQTQYTATSFPDFKVANIPGAPNLAAPQLLTGESGAPLITEGYGTAAPAFYDWDGDGLKDLLVGEFGSGAEAGRYIGNFIRVYLNIGTVDNPVFAGDFNYARPPYELPINGTPYSVDQFCCIGFTPQFVDINGDGFTDMLSGQYFGEIMCFKGSEQGFRASDALWQEGNPRENAKDYKAHAHYWLYSAVSFGDFTGDGKLDAIIGGRAIRLSENIGSLSKPQFGIRQLVQDLKGNPLKVYEYTEKELASGHALYTAGDYKLSPVAVDWDSDGILDLLVTNSYNHDKLSVVDFFRGRKVGEKCIFEQGVPLIQVKEGSKAFPGISPFVSVVDWNNDGVNDLLIGTSVAVVGDKFNSFFSWNWEHDIGLHGIAKDPSLVVGKNRDASVKWILQEVKLPPDMTSDDFLTMRHQGYVYVMLGSKASGPGKRNVKGL